MLFLTIWPATVLTPARLGLLLMSDIVVGVISAALWSGEPFGWREGIGTMMIVGAGFVEVLGHKSQV
jgi:drug/metabolite transporter (DMT)-like permease